MLELMMVIGAVLALGDAIRRLRRDGDPTNLALWFASIVYLLVTEIPLYFPNLFGIQDDRGGLRPQRVHGAVPVRAAAALHRRSVSGRHHAGISRSSAPRGFRARGIVVGAVCVGFVHHCFYEVFDQLGPQLRWWAWNTDNPINHPMFASVPMTSMFIFATLGPIEVRIVIVRQPATTAISAPRRYGATSGRSSPLQNRPGSNQFDRFSVSIRPISS